MSLLNCDQAGEQSCDKTEWDNPHWSQPDLDVWEQDDESRVSHQSVIINATVCPSVLLFGDTNNKYEKVLKRWRFSSLGMTPNSRLITWVSAPLLPTRQHLLLAGEGGDWCWWEQSRAGASDVILTWWEKTSANLIGVYQCEVCLAKSIYRFDLKLFFIDIKSG